MAKPLFQGVITALVTPFRDGAVDEAAFAALVERQVAAGVHGVVPVGTTGESATVSLEEHKRIVELCVQVCAARIQVIAGAGANETGKAIDLVRHAKTVGADAALVVTPYYNRPSQEGMYRHYAAINDAVELPVVLYNVPSRTGVDLANETVERLAPLPNVVGIKDATGDLARASLMRRTVPEGFALISGDDPTLLGYMAHGGHGVISVTSNVAPEACVARYEAAARGDFATALTWQDRLIGLDRALFLDNSPAPAKYALAKLGLGSDEVRLPLGPCADAVKPRIDAALAEAGVG
ncbi:MAG TPA: 4-hydroxy-tetrahydrodipicolinate synthase [Caulobacteraceae bacterium]|nr:4-hydroxy-tetrahydrodipicolinate synthase [Caulobacteraceae bacterium]